MLTAIPVRWLEANGWRVRVNLNHPRPLPGGEQPFGWVRRVRRDLFTEWQALGRSADFQSAVSPNCIRQSAGSIPRVGVSQRLAECNSAIQQSSTLRYDGALNTHARQTQHARACALPDSLSSLRSFAAKSIMADRRDALSYGALDELRNSAILLIAATSKI